MDGKKGRERSCPEAEGEFQEGVNPPQPPGVNPRARRREGTAFPVTAGRGVKRIASESHS